MLKSIFILIGIVFLVNSQFIKEGLLDIKEREAIKLKDLETLQESEDNQIEKRQQCPNSCSGHGYCQLGGTCLCNPGYEGDDCSYAVINVNPQGGVYSGSISTSQWIFYAIATNEGSGMTVTVNQTSFGGDIDLYLLQDDIPTKSHFAYRDISTSASVVVTVSDAGEYLWYIGLYGYLSTSYTISITTTSSQCPLQNNCNPPNGVCTSSGVCTCNPGFAGSDCSLTINSINMGNSYPGYVTFGKWQYYSVSVPNTNSLTVNVIETSLSGDVDVYVKFGGVPTLWNYDYKDAGFTNNTSLYINQPNTGVYYIGVYGFKTTSYNIKVTTQVQCPSQCSYHGTCVNGNSCSCYAGYSGTYCQTYNNLMTAGTVYTGYVGGSAWNYYKASPNTLSNMVITLNQSSIQGDCDLYVRNGANPTQFVYDYRDIGFGRSFSLTVANPSTYTWYIGVFGYASCAYTVTYTVTNQCPNGCSGNGVCNSEGVCICNSGFGGNDCSIASIPVLVNGATTPSFLNSTGQWNFYQITVTNTTFVTVVLRETQSTGFLWLYVSRDETPDTRDYDYSDQETNTNFHPIHIEYDNQASHTLFIGVYSNPYSINGGILPYNIAAWYSPF